MILTRPDHKDITQQTGGNTQEDNTDFPPHTFDVYQED
jgi:hypothetical protein